MANKKFLRGLGQGIARVSEIALVDALQARREKALAEMREQYDVKREERAIEREGRMEQRALDREERQERRQDERLKQELAARERMAGMDKNAQVIQIEVPVMMRDASGKQVPVTYTDAQGNVKQQTRTVAMERQKSGEWKEINIPAAQPKPATPAVPAAQPVAAPAQQTATAQPSAPPPTSGVAGAAYNVGRGARSYVESVAPYTPAALIPKAMKTVGSAVVGPAMRGLLDEEDQQAAAAGR